MTSLLQRAAGSKPIKYIQSLETVAVYQRAVFFCHFLWPGAHVYKWNEVIVPDLKVCSLHAHSNGDIWCQANVESQFPSKSAAGVE